ncbi:MAG TPA: hypothetical protein VMM84_01650 [Pyrinomonadaceae bacterium]|nr:hypothetical protein [Pyrinomonadaceae bacterium]
MRNRVSYGATERIVERIVGHHPFNKGKLTTPEWITGEYFAVPSAIPGIKAKPILDHCELRALRLVD